MTGEESTHLRKASIFYNGVKLLVQNSGQKLFHFIWVQVSYSALCVRVCVPKRQAVNLTPMQ